MRQFSDVQKKYMEAKARNDVAKARFDELRKPVDDDWNQGKMSDEEWAYKVTDIEFSCGFADAHSELLEAERELVAWAKEKLDAETTEEQKAEIAIVWENWHLAGVRDQVIDICMRLQV